MTSIRDRVRPVVHLARRLRDRTLHRYRRRQAIDSLRGMRIREIVVLCHGNICRSPFLGVSLLSHLAAQGLTDVRVRSAGFVGPGRPSPDVAIAVASDMGFDLRSHRSVLVTAGDLQGADLVVVMSGEQASDVRWRGAPPRVPVIVLGDLDPEPIDGRTIVDPWKCDESVFRSSYERIDRCAEELARAIGSNRQ